jgi:regulator of protease activity HflC (stomatin/prohibitin superfamily)
MTGSFGTSRVVDADDANNFLHKLRSGGMTVVIAIGLLILFWSSVTSVPAGHVGVMSLFGKVDTRAGETLGEGIHFVNPFKSVREMSVRTQTVKETSRVPSSEGLEMALDTSLIFHVRADKAAELYQRVGTNYLEVLVEPQLRSSIREATASHSANALYSSARVEVQEQIRKDLEASLAPRGIEIENVLLRDIQLPPTVQAAIQAKQQAEQESLAMSFKLQKEKQEAERKRIEAQGIQDFQRIVSQGISTQLLEWKGIEATEALAKSPNSKIVVIGNSKNGLPLVLGGTDR